MKDARDFRRRTDALAAEQRVLTRQLGDEQARLAALQVEALALEKARALVQAAALRTQETLRVRLTALGTTALRAVFADRELTFNVAFDSKRGRTEAVLEVEKVVRLPARWTRTAAGW